MSATILDERRRVFVCIGSGGVGKTSIAAALGMEAARRGRRTVVVTIDPARRLAAALGLDTLDDLPRPVSLERLAPDAPREPPRLFATMLDQARAWGRLVERHVQSEPARKRLVENPFYRHLSESFGGSHEFLAVERLCELCDDPAWQCVILDTPPSRHALDLFEAPERILGFLDPRLLRFLTAQRARTSAGRAAQWAGRRASSLLSRLEEATGAEVLAQLGDFFVAVSALFDALAARAHRSAEIFRADDTALVLVSGPGPAEAAQAEAFFHAMADRDLAPAVVIANRVHPASAAAGDLGEGDRARVIAALREGGVVDEKLGSWIAGNFLDHQREARAHAAALRDLREVLPRSIPLVTVPDFESDLHAIEGLDRLRRSLMRDGRGA